MADPLVIPVVGQPVAWGIGLLVLVAVVFTGTWAGSLVTVAHEGGHMAVAALVGRGPRGFWINENVGGGATRVTGGWGAGRILTLLAGYLTPPLVGLAGATAVVDGLSWSVLWAALILLVGAFLQADGLFTHLVVLLAGLGIGWVAVRGSAEVQTASAVALVWLMLLGGVRSLVHLGLGGGESDAAALAHDTWIPRILWVALFWTVALGCLWAGGRRLLGV